MRKIKKWLTAFKIKFKLDDSKQQTAFQRLIRFFAVMLVLTVIARGTAGATMPIVQAVSPSIATIAQSLKSTGVIRRTDGAIFTAPEGLTVQKLNAAVGEDVTEKQIIAIFDENEINQTISEQKAQLNKMQVQYKQLSNAVPADAYGVGEAQKALDNAYAAHNKAIANGDAAISTATEKRDAAQRTLDGLQAASPQDAAAIAAASEQLAIANAEINAAITAAQSAISAAQNGALSAQNARDSALHSYHLQAADAEKAGEVNKADANILSVQMKAQTEKIKVLEQIKANGNTLLAPQKGILLELNLAQGMPSSQTAGSISSENSEQLLTFVLNEEDGKKITTGTPIQITQEDELLEAKISSLSLSNADGNITASVRLQDSKFKSGACEVLIEYSRKKYSLCLPSTAIHQDSAGTFVYVIEKSNTVLGIQNVLTRISVTVEEQGETQTAVTGALTFQSVVAGNASKLLINGAKVRVEP